MAADYDRMAQIIDYLHDNFRAQPDLATIAAHVGLSEFHLQRLFRRWAGISPKRYLQYLTAEYARARLQDSRDVLNTTYDAGLSSPGRLHDLTVNVYAMTPGEVKAGGAGNTITTGIHNSPFGECLIGATARGVCALRFVEPGARAAALSDLRTEWPHAYFEQDAAITSPVFARIFGGTDAPHTISLLMKGTNFQIRVWEALLRIPAGALVTYGDVAAHLGSPGAARAVGSAVGRNPIAYLIPCHRVIRSQGIIGAYRWSATRKRAIIGWEAAQIGA
ncbi:MAG: methylated-DNA--[protein]-cysteine S-methyltransferase [Anaerolineae bacterium]|nr:methylated-DNA--[protein]-cysteine S-methyltransferase [Anaerolineae bacterium]